MRSILVLGFLSESDNQRVEKVPGQIQGLGSFPGQKLHRSAQIPCSAAKLVNCVHGY
jgi:hypothetical protein